MTDVQQQPEQNPDNDQEPVDQPEPGRENDPGAGQQDEEPEIQPDATDGFDND